MAKLTEMDKQALRELSQRGWKQSAEELRPAIDPVHPASIEALCRWAALLSKQPANAKPVRSEAPASMYSICTYLNMNSDTSGIAGNRLSELRDLFAGGRLAVYR